MKPLTTAQRFVFNYIRGCVDRNAAIDNQGNILYTIYGHKRGMVSVQVKTHNGIRWFERPGFVAQRKCVTPFYAEHIYNEVKE